MFAKRTLIACMALASCAAMAQEGSYLRGFLTPVNRGTPTFGGIKMMGSNAQRFMLIQPIYTWGEGFTGFGSSFAVVDRPYGSDGKRSSVYGITAGQTSPDDDDEINTALGFFSHQFHSDSAMSQGTLTGFFSTQAGAGDIFGFNYNLATKVSLFNDSGHFLVSGAVNYAMLDASAGEDRRGAAFSVNIARDLGDKFTVEYDHTFASKFLGQKSWFFRTTFYPEVNGRSQLRITVATGESFALEYGWRFGS